MTEDSLTGWNTVDVPFPEIKLAPHTQLLLDALQKYDRILCSLPGVGGMYIDEEHIIVTVLPKEDNPQLPPSIPVQVRDLIRFRVHTM